MTPYSSLMARGFALVATSEWGVPSIQFDESREAICWPREEARGIVRTQSDISNGTLNEFANLHKACAKESATFAQVWGPLYLCGKHGAPRTHGELFWPMSQAAKPRRCAIRTRKEQDTGRIWQWEGVAGWRVWSRRADALLNIAHELQVEKIAPLSAWLDAYDVPTEMRAEHGFIEVASLEAAWKELSCLLNIWLELDPGSIFVKPFATGATPQIGGTSLFGALAIQLMFCASNVTSTGYTCDSCGKLYFPRRKPQEGRRKFCDACRSAMNALHQNEYRARKKMKGHLV